MLEVRFIRENADRVRKAIQDKGEAVDFDRYLELDGVRREVVGERDRLRHEHNTASETIARLKRDGQDAAGQIADMKALSSQIKELDQKIRTIDTELTELRAAIPNIPHPSVPVGDVTANEVVRDWGKPREFSFSPLPHWEIGKTLGLLDFEAASKIAGAHFVLYRGLGARLERALINFMLDVSTKEKGYTEVFPPFLTNREAMFATGQLPKLEEDMYRCEVDDLFLNPTGEVPITNLHREEVLREDQLPLKYAAYTACFRREAGSYGRDTRGLLRIHQFNKVELVKFVVSESSYEELETLLSDAEDVLQRLGLPYRVVCLATRELSFAAAKCYDLEVWAPGVAQWLEVSSASNFEDFQARRANVRVRRSGKTGTELVHTLNASALATPRTVVAIIEHYQQEDGSVVIPEALRPYMDGLERLR
ncbi:seryl-tRNA synthetase [candidate division TA06 bacterium SM23_40]|uniref:Serine--tRNA ligase n=2 Tax=Bacteria division TA06 TaxID=1156500 RepID=A0A0S8G5B0_UNCT6|nr:MAG: seryl-tRNA synthetase [candidate division TA06 bacterium SM23_40]